MKPFKTVLKHPDEKGQSLVELAVGIVVLLTLLAGIVDLGRLLFFYIAMRDAAQEGAVYGQLNPIYCQDIVNRVNDYLRVAPGQPGYTVIVEIKKPTETSYIDCAHAETTPASPTRVCSGNDLRVQVTAPFEFVMPFLSGGTINVSTQITGTILRPLCSN